MALMNPNISDEVWYNYSFINKYIIVNGLIKELIIVD